MKALQVIESAYRCTIEEQDDPVIWITHAMKGAGAELGVLLRGNAVNYALAGQDASGLAFGGRVQRQPPQIDRDVATLAGKGVEIFVVMEDCEARGLPRERLVDGVKQVPRRDLPAIFARYDQVWHW